MEHRDGFSYSVERISVDEVPYNVMHSINRSRYYRSLRRFLEDLMLTDELVGAWLKLSLEVKPDKEISLERARNRLGAAIRNWSESAKLDQKGIAHRTQLVRDVDNPDTRGTIYITFKREE